MKLTFRWYGEKDCIPLEYIKQIQGMTGVVTAVYDVPVGEVWSVSALQRLKTLANGAGLEMEVIESIPVHEDIKLGKPTRDKLIANYAQNIINCGKVGVKCVCYNFMPVFDWFRTNLYYKHSDGSTSLSYSEEDFKKLDKHNLRLPGWDESYTSEQLNGLLKEYEGITHEKLFENLVYFLKGIMPACNEAGVNMAIHPDDPPWDIFGLPRIVGKEADYDRLFAAVPDMQAQRHHLLHGFAGCGAVQRFAEDGGEVREADLFRAFAAVEVRKRNGFLRKRASDVGRERRYLRHSESARRKRVRRLSSPRPRQKHLGGGRETGVRLVRSCAGRGVLTGRF